MAIGFRLLFHLFSRIHSHFIEIPIYYPPTAGLKLTDSMKLSPPISQWVVNFAIYELIESTAPSPRRPTFNGGSAAAPTATT